MGTVTQLTPAVTDNPHPANLGATSLGETKHRATSCGSAISGEGQTALSVTPDLDR